MGSYPAETSEAKQWESVHVCPACGHAIKLADIDLKAVTTGMNACPSCNWFGPISIEIIEQEKSKE